VVGGSRLDFPPMAFWCCCGRRNPESESESESESRAEGGERQAGQTGFHVHDAMGMRAPRPEDGFPAAVAEGRFSDRKQSSNQRSETMASEKSEMAMRVLPAVRGDKLTQAGKSFEEIIMRELGVEQPDLFMAFQHHLEEAQTAPITSFQSLAWRLEGTGVKAVFEVKPGRDGSTYAVGWAYRKKQLPAHDLPVADDWELPLRTQLATSFTDAGARGNMPPCVTIAVPHTNPAP